MKSRPFFVGLVCLLASTAWAEIDPLDWTYCRGPASNATSPETGLIDNWNPKGGEGSNVAWMRKDLGSRSTPIVMDGKLYTILRADPGTNIEGERVVCLDAITGETIWENKFNVYLSDVPDTRVGWSSVTGDPDTGLVYALGVCGHFQCLMVRLERLFGRYRCMSDLVCSAPTAVVPTSRSFATTW